MPGKNLFEPFRLGELKRELQPIPSQKKFFVISALFAVNPDLYFLCDPAKCFARMSSPKSPLKSRQTAWMWLALPWVLAYSRRKVGPCTR